MKKNLLLMMCLVSTMVMIGCDKDDDIHVSKVPEAVVETFQAKFPNAEFVEWETYKDYYIADFWLSGADTQVWISKNAIWRMTETDLGVNLAKLPSAVQTAFQSSKYADWRVDDLDKYERPDRTFYLIEIEKKGERDRDLYYAEDGTLLKDEQDRENNDVTPDTQF